MELGERKLGNNRILGYDTVNGTLVPNEDNERKSGVYQHIGTPFLYGKVFCSECGNPYIRKSELVKNEMSKVWKCADRAKGKKGGGCKAARITEEALLHQISDQLGWEWRGVDDFDSGRFASAVKRVEVYGERVWVVKKAAA